MKIKETKHWTGKQIGTPNGVNSLTIEDIQYYTQRYDVMIMERDGEVTMWLDDKGRKFSRR